MINKSGGVGMSDFGEMRNVKTRKPHICEYCGQGKGVGKMINDGMFTSATDQWATPIEFFEKQDALFHCACKLFHSI